MGCLAQHFTGLKWPPLSSSGLRKPFSAKQYVKPRFFRIVAAVATSNAETKGRLALKEEFEEAYERCRTAPMEGVSFTLEDFYAALDKYDFSSEIGDKVEGTVLFTNNNGALVDIRAKCLAFLPVHAACIRKIKHVEEAGIFPDMRAEFLIVGENQSNDSLILSLRSMQNDLSWERCRQLQAEDVIVKGKVVGTNKGGLEVLVENLDGFVPFSQLSSKSTAEELLERELPLKFLNVDEKKPGIVLSNRKAMEELLAQLPVGSVVTGIVQSVKPYGAFIDIGGINGLLHVGQISHDRVSEISAVLQPGDTLKVMIISHDRKKGRISLSTKKLEPTPGDMIRNPKLVFEKAEVMAKTFRQRIAQAEAMARADMLRFQPESRLTLNSDGILMPLSADLPEAGLDLSDVLPALKTQS